MPSKLSSGDHARRTEVPGITFEPSTSTGARGGAGGGAAAVVAPGSAFSAPGSAETAGTGSGASGWLRSTSSATRSSGGAAASSGPCAPANPDPASTCASAISAVASAAPSSWWNREDRDIRGGYSTLRESRSEKIGFLDRPSALRTGRLRADPRFWSDFAPGGTDQESEPITSQIAVVMRSSCSGSIT